MFVPRAVVRLRPDGFVVLYWGGGGGEPLDGLVWGGGGGGY